MFRNHTSELWFCKLMGLASTSGAPGAAPAGN
jgi:hypothetical protein